MKRRTSGYFLRMLAILAVTGVFPLLVLGTTFIGIYEASFTSATVENARAQAGQAAAEMDALLNECVNLLQNCVQQMTVKSVLSYRPGKVEIASLYDVLQLLTFERGDNLAVHVVGEQRYFSSTQVPQHYLYSEFSHTAQFAMLDSLPRTAVFFSRPYTDDQGREVALSVVMPVCNYHDHFVGYAIVDVYKAALNRVIAHSGASLDVAIWMDGLCLTDVSAQGLPAPDELAKAAADDGILWQENMCIFSSAMAHSRFTMVCSFDIAQLNAVKTQAVTLMSALIAVTTALAFVMALVLSIHQSRPILQLYRAMDKVGRGDMETQLNVRGNDELADLGRRFNLLVRQLDQSNRERAERDEELKKQEIAILQAQINPHFLYNSLGAARSLIRLGVPDKASEILLRLSTLFHASFKAVGRMVTLRESVSLVSDNIAIENIRYHNRFQFITNIPEELNACVLPSLLLQPIVENAIKHGLEMRPQGGVLRMTAVRDGEAVVIVIEDDGVGIDPAVAAELNDTLPRGSHIGFRNVRRRIELCYGEGYGAHIEPLERGTRVTLRIRYEVGEESCTDC